jgi:hypothetical protein
MSDIVERLPKFVAAVEQTDISFRVGLKAIMLEAATEIETLRATQSDLVKQINGLKDALAQAEGIIYELRHDDECAAERCVAAIAAIPPPVGFELTAQELLGQPQSDHHPKP